MSAHDEDLVSALEIIESQPLPERANGYARLHDDLARRLEGSADPNAGVRG